MERIRFEEHQGKKILIVDLSENRDIQLSISLLAQARKVIDAQPAKSLLILTNVANAHYDPQAVDAMKKFSAANTPFLKASAVVGIGGIKRVLYQAVVKLSGRSIATFDTVDEAKDWLASQ